MCIFPWSPTTYLHWPQSGLHLTLLLHQGTEVSCLQSPAWWGSLTLAGLLKSRHFFRAQMRTRLFCYYRSSALKLQDTAVSYSACSTDVPLLMVMFCLANSSLLHAFRHPCHFLKNMKKKSGSTVVAPATPKRFLSTLKIDPHCWIHLDSILSAQAL